MQLNNISYGVDVQLSVETRPDFATKEPVVVLRISANFSITMSPDEARRLSEQLAAAAAEHEEIANDDRR